MVRVMGIDVNAKIEDAYWQKHGTYSHKPGGKPTGVTRYDLMATVSYRIDTGLIGKMGYPEMRMEYFLDGRSVEVERFEACSKDKECQFKHFLVRKSSPAEERKKLRVEVKAISGLVVRVTDKTTVTTTVELEPRKTS